MAEEAIEAEELDEEGVVEDVVVVEHDSGDDCKIMLGVLEPWQSVYELPAERLCCKYDLRA